MENKAILERIILKTIRLPVILREALSSLADFSAQYQNSFAEFYNPPSDGPHFNFYTNRQQSEE